MRGACHRARVRTTRWHHPGYAIAYFCRNARRFYRLDLSWNSAANAGVMNAQDLRKIADWLIDGFGHAMGHFGNLQTFLWQHRR